MLAGCGTEPTGVPNEPKASIAAHRTGASVPSPRGYPLLAYDPIKDQVWLVGGLTTDAALIYDLWTFSAQSRRWRQVQNVFAPTSWDALALDVQSRKIVVFQPYNAAFDAVDVETWAYDIETGVWENRHPAVQPPSRWGSMMVYDPKADRVLLYGGANFAEWLACGYCDTPPVWADLWAYDYESNTWTELHPSVSPPPHHFPVLEYVPTIDRVILFGGFGFPQGTPSLFNDTWAYDYQANRWTNLTPANPPAPRAYHYMAFEPRTNRIVMFGGILDVTDPEPTTNDTWIYSVAMNSWKRAFPEDPPSPRAWHAMSRTSGPVLLFGGGPVRFPGTNDTYLYSSRSNQWEQVGGGAQATDGRTAVSAAAIAGSMGARHHSREGPVPHR
jgi:hypothetical protein